jgi:hypothetical protein
VPRARGITPTYVAGFRAFLALNRCVRQGEKAIKILAPVSARHSGGGMRSRYSRRLGLDAERE